MIKGAIFDMDGTLVDSMTLWYQLGYIYLQSLHIDAPRNIREEIDDLTMYEGAEYVWKKYCPHLTTAEVNEGFYNIMLGGYGETFRLKPGAKEYLYKLKENGVKLCIATATPVDLTEIAMRRLGIWDLFEDIASCDKMKTNKREPRVYRRALEILGTDRSNTLVYEDALFAIQTAKNDGFQTVGVFDQYEKSQEKMRREADHFIADYREEVKNFEQNSFYGRM